MIISINEIQNFRCGAGKIKLNPLHLNSTENNKRRLAKEYTPIKIGVDYSSFTKPSSMNNDTFNQIKNSIEETTKEFPKFLRVQHTDYDLSGQEESIKKSCELNTIGNGFANYLKDYDIVIFPSFSNQLSSDEVSSGKLCLTHGSRPRPTAGLLAINPNFNFNLKNNDLFLKQIFFHEMTHILVFDQNLLKQLGMTTNKKSRTYVTSPKVLAKAKQHYNCQSITEIPLEDQIYLGNDPGTHWDARYMLGDYMITSFYTDMILSDITIALFEDTKYYEADYYSGGLFKFGKNKGCNFINKNCIENKKPLFSEFCTSSDNNLCTSSKLSKANCIINDYINYNITIPSQYRYFDNPNHGGNFFVDFCPVPDTFISGNDYFSNNCKIGTSTLSPEYAEEMSDTSFCFVSSLTPPNNNYNITTRSMCYKTECNKDTKQIVVHVGTSTYICPTDGGITSGGNFKGYLTCPKYYEICDTESLQLCNDIFDCLNKKIAVNDDSFNLNANTTFDRYRPTSFSKNIKNNYYAYYSFIIIFLMLII